jgi:hypothetical protein
MSKNKGKSLDTRYTPITQYTPITHYTASLNHVGDSGDETVEVTTHKHVEIEAAGRKYPLTLNAHECRRLAAGLLKAADVLDGGQSPEEQR